MADLTASLNKYYLTTINGKKYLAKINDAGELKIYSPVIPGNVVIARANYAICDSHVAALNTQTVT